MWFWIVWPEKWIWQFQNTHIHTQKWNKIKKAEVFSHFASICLIQFWNRQLWQHGILQCSLWYLFNISYNYWKMKNLSLGHIWTCLCLSSSKFSSLCVSWIFLIVANTHIDKYDSLTSLVDLQETITTYIHISC